MIWRIFVLLVLATASLALRAEEKNFSLQECIRVALKHNLALGVKIVDRGAQEGLLGMAKEKFLPALSFTFSKQRTNSPTYSFTQAQDQLQQTSSGLAARIDQSLWLGGTLSLEMEASRFDTNQRFQTINPRYDGQIKFEWVQPLLRDMGDRISRHDIIIARNNRDASENDLKAGLIDTVYNVESLYWNLAYAIRNLEAKNQALQLAEDLLARNRKMVEQGLLAEIEILSAEAEVATRKADILGAQALVANTRDQLQTEMNLAAEENGGAWEVVPADEPQDVEKPVDLEAIWKAAVENRPDLLNAGINLQSKTLEFEVARNRLLPALNLNAQYWSPGLSGNQLIYLNNDPLTGVIVAVIPGGASAAMKDALDFKYQNWQLWLSLQLPLGAWISRGDYTAARMNRKSALLQRQDLEQKVPVGVEDRRARCVQQFPEHSGLPDGAGTGRKKNDR